MHLVRKRRTADNAARPLTSKVRRDGRYARVWLMFILQSKCFCTSCTNPLFADVLGSLQALSYSPEDGGHMHTNLCHITETVRESR